MTILIFILVLSFLVIIHELGHFLVARHYRVKVEEFGLGYPPRIKKLFNWLGTSFTLNAIPFGGFVKLKGEEFDPHDHQPYDDAFYAKPAIARINTMLAGPVVNILFGVIAFSIVFGVLGAPRFLDNRPRIEHVADSSPAAAALEANYEITGFRLFDDYIATPEINDVIEFVNLNRGEEVTVVLVGPCDGFSCAEMSTEAPVYLRTEAETPAGEGSMGVVFQDFFFETGPWYTRVINGAIYGFKEAISLGILIVVALIDLIRQLVTTGSIPAGVAGPVGIVHQASQNQFLTTNWAALLEFAGMLSINLGIMNIMPIPALDGGRVLFVLLEKVFGKQRIQAVEGYVHYGGYLLLLALIILVSFKDVWQIFRG